MKKIILDNTSGMLCLNNYVARENGHASLDGFMFATKSAIRNGLSLAKEQRQARSEEIMSNIDEVENDNELATADAVKVLHFDQHDEID